MGDWLDLPLFPLNTVLFPGMLLPLHIFEERYKLMIGRCLEEQRPFGVLLIQEGQEVEGAGAPAVPYDVGTTAIIAGASQMDDGRYNLVTIGDERFRLHSIRHDQPYLVGRAEPWPLADPPGSQAESLAASVRALFERYLALLARAQGHKIEIDQVPGDPRGFALLAAIAMQVPITQKQHLLCQPSVVELLRAEWALLQREGLLLDFISRTQAEQWLGGFSGWLANN